MSGPDESNRRTPADSLQRLEYDRAAELAGADLVFNQCSSVGEAADKATRTVKTPVITIYSRIAEVACETGSRTGVVATLETTVGPNCRLIEATARRFGKKVKITRCLVSGALDLLVGGNRAKRNEAALEIPDSIRRNFRILRPVLQKQLEHII